MTLPAKGEPHDRGLTRDEAAALIRQCWRYRETQVVHLSQTTHRLCVEAVKKADLRVVRSGLLVDARIDALGRARLKTDIRALAFDTGGTLLDWHGGLTAAFTQVGMRKKIDRDWALLTNEYRRRSLSRMLNAVQPNFNIDDVNREELDRLLREKSLAFDDQDIQVILAAWHQLEAWPDVRQGLRRLREKFLVVPLTILSLSLIIDTARKNGIVWDAVLSCELFGIYKFNPEPYRLAAEKLALDPSQIMMVACHNLDLAAARSVGYRGAYIQRSREWGPEANPDRAPDHAIDIVASGLCELADQLDVP